MAVAETGAFNKAAAKLGINASVVSHHVSKLEDFLGSTLIYRTTRKLSLSPQGRTLYEAGRLWIDGTADALDRIRDAQEEAIGALRVTLPAFVPDPRIEDAILAFARMHPNVSLSLNYSDSVSDLLEDSFDLSIRIGNPPDSSFRRRKLIEIPHILVASPEFLAIQGTPESPGELGSLPIVYMKGSTDNLRLMRGSDVQEIQAESAQIETNSIFGAFAAAKRGLGIAGLPVALCEQSLASGKLVRVIPQWQLPKLTVQAIWPDASRRESLTKRLINHVVTSI